MTQQYDLYTPESHAVWKILFERQADNLAHKACSEYLQCLQQMQSHFHAQQIPHFDEVNQMLYAQTGWGIEVVKGIIPVEEFVELLAQRKFPSSTWLRRRDQLDYLEEPDMFHDSFGHMPLLMHPLFAQFMEEFGKLGCKYIQNHDIILQLQRLYWFTIEFGVIGTNAQNCQIYGAGIISSYGETNHIYQPKVSIVPFDLETVIHTDFRTDQIQTRYFQIQSFEQLFNTIQLLQASYTKP